LRPILKWAVIPQRLMRPVLVVPLYPIPNDPPCLLKCLKDVLPDTLFFETPKEPFDDPILFRRIRRDELLCQPIIPTGLPKATTLKDQPIVTPQDWRSHRSQGAEPRRQAASTARSASFARLRNANS
jgi:hypothetical protein